MFKPILAAIIFTSAPVAAVAHNQHPHIHGDGTLIQQQQQQIIIEQRSNPLVPILGAAILGGAIIYGANQNNRSYHYHHEYRRDGRRYRICRDHHRRYYC